MAAILKLAILDSAILVFPLKLTHTCQDWFPPFAQKKPSLIHSDSTWWWQPSWILPCWIQTVISWIQTPSYLLSNSLKNTLTPLWILTQTTSIWLKLIHSDSTWWWQPSWILPCWIQTPSYLLSDTLKNNSLHSDSWIKLIQSDSNLFIVTQLDDGSHLEFYHLEFGHLGFSHLSFSSQTHSHLPRLVTTICTKKPSLIHSDSTWWWEPSWILPCWIKKTVLIHSDSTWWWQPSWIMLCWIQTPCFLLSDLLQNTLTPLWLWLKLIQSDSNSFILTQLDDVTHLEFHNLGISHLSFASQTHLTLAKIGSYHLHKKNLCSFIRTQLDDGSHLEFCHLGFRCLVFFSQIHSKTLSLHSDSDSN